jgi:acetoin utilization deacetylase AcuC-like enzyme
MGFCLFGTVAIAVKHALDHHGLSRVAIVDFDVHHGNGTQDLLWDEARCLFASSHQMPLYPGTGAASETGAHGQIVNVPLREGSGGGVMRAAYEAKVFPALVAWKPELILISAGFDAHADDPLAGLEWQTEDYTWLTTRICDLADELAGGRVVSCLEGGYDLPALTASVRAHVGVLQERGR